MLASLAAGRPVPIEERPSLADCMAGTIDPDNKLTFRMSRDLVDETAIVPEDAIIPAMRHAFREERQILEGGAALPIARLLAEAGQFPG